MKVLTSWIPKEVNKLEPYDLSRNADASNVDGGVRLQHSQGPSPDPGTDELAEAATGGTEARSDDVEDNAASVAATDEAIDHVDNEAGDPDVSSVIETPSEHVDPYGDLSPLRSQGSHRISESGLSASRHAVLGMKSRLRPEVMLMAAGHSHHDAPQVAPGSSQLPVPGKGLATAATLDTNNFAAKLKAFKVQAKDAKLQKENVKAKDDHESETQTAESDKQQGDLEEQMQPEEYVQFRETDHHDY